MEFSLSDYALGEYIKELKAENTRLRGEIAKINDVDLLARWLCATKEFVNRDGPCLELDDEYDVWVLAAQDHSHAPSPHDLAKAILQFLQIQN